MMVSRKSFYLAAVGILVLLGIVLVMSYSSLWLYWNLLPQSQALLRIAWDNSHVHDDLLAKSILTSEIAPMLPSEVGSVVKVAFVQEQEGSYLVIKPHIWQAFSLKAALEDGGWTVKNYGILLRASKGSGSSLQAPTITHGAKAALKQVISHPSTIFPALLAMSYNATDQQTYQTIIFTHRKAIDGVIRKSGESISGIKTINFSQQKITELNGLYLTIPSKLLGLVTEKYSDQWMEQTLTKLGFIKTYPDLLGELKQYPISIIAQSQDSIVVGVKGDADPFVKEAQAWIENEDAFNRSRRHPFQLPDKTLGYEVLPGAKRPSLGSLGADGCASSLSEYIKAWVCQKDNAAVIASSKEAALKALDAALAGVSTVSGEAINLIGFPKLNAVHVKIIGDSTSFHLTFL